MIRGFRNCVTAYLVVSLIATSAFFAAPSPVKAETGSCLAGVLWGILKGKDGKVQAEGEGAAGANMSVPSYDAAVKAYEKANQDVNSNISGQTQGFTIQRCIVEPLVTTMARALLDNFTAQTVKWINSGFKGSPLYVTNLEGFLTDVADQTVGQFIESLGPIGQILCSPFDLQLRLSLNFQYSSDFRQEIGCRLSDIQNNVQRAFTGGNFGNDGWNNWIQLTSEPQNNVYGAYLKATDNVDNQIANKINNEIKKLDWGKGFLSSTDPETGEVSTPGTLIEDQLSETLGQGVRNVGMAKDIDAILNALVGQMINQVLGPGGLLGAGKSSGGRQSAVDRGLGATAENVIAANKAAQNLPNGLFIETGFSSTGVPTRIGPTATDPSGKSTGPTPLAFCTQFRKNRYSADKSTTGNTLTSNTLVVVYVNGSVADPLTGGLPANLPAVATQKQGGQWTLADYNAVATYCQNVQLTTPLAGATDDFNVQTKNAADANATTSTPTTPPPNPETNLARGKTARQSSVWNNGRGTNFDASYAVQGAHNGSLYSSAITNEGSDNWWTVDLGENKTIGRVDVYEFLSRTFTGCVIVSQLPFGSSALPCDGKTDSATYKTFPLNPSGSDPLSRMAANNLVGRYIWVQQRSHTDNMILNEVEVYGTARTGGAGGNLEPISFAPATNYSKPASSGCNADYNLSCGNFSNTFTITANTAETGLKARIKFLKTQKTGPDKEERFFTVFAPGSLTVSGVTIDVTKTAVTYAENFSPAAGYSGDITETGRLRTASVADPYTGNTAGSAVVNDPENPSYKLVLEIFKVVDGKEQVLATQTTTFKIQ